MANQTPEPRALSAALAAPPFATRGGGVAMHAANRHVERWAPETGASSVRAMRSLGFVDRLVAPWIETAQRSASMRLFSQYVRSGAGEREGGAVSWVFPRPWYQDELDWMAAAREAPRPELGSPAEASPTLFTTRGTYVAPAQQAIAARRSESSTTMPAALYEYVAPSLSIASPAPQRQIAGIGYGGSADAYSPLISLAAVQAAALMSHAVAPLTARDVGQAPTTVGRVSPALRGVLTTMLERATTSRAVDVPATRLSQYAPELVTPPAPRPSELGGQPTAAYATTTSSSATSAYEAPSSPATQLADHYAEQRVQIVELQRIARQSAERELAARATSTDEPRAAAQAFEAELRQRTTASTTTAARGQAEAQVRAQAEAQVRAQGAQIADATQRAQAAQAVETQRREDVAERARIEARIAERIAERTTGQRLHEQARTEAAAHARSSLAVSAESQAAAQAAQPVVGRGAPAEVLAAIAALPPELAALLANRPERGMAAITELHDALRTAELLARSTASGATFEVTRGPRLMMPAGLGGLVSAVDRAHTIARPTQAGGVLAGQGGSAPAAFAPVAPRSDARMPTLPWLEGARPTSSTVGRGVSSSPTGALSGSMAPSTALGATAAAAPAALTHVAWADRWLARFAGATPRSLEVLRAASTASPELRMQALAAAAPDAIFVAPVFDNDSQPRPSATSPRFAPVAASGAGEAVIGPMLRQPLAPHAAERFDDSAETPDDVFAQIAAAAAGARATTRVATSSASGTSPAISASPSVYDPNRISPADAVAQAAPSAPGAGLSAQLAASPFAPALRHVLPLPSSASFDVRSLFGGGLSATYLAGLLATSSHELEISSAAPSWATSTILGAPFVPAGTLAAERATPEWDATYVVPEASADAPAFAAIQSGAHADAPSGGAASDATSVVAPGLLAATASPSYGEALTTLRTVLLSWNVETRGGEPVSFEAPALASTQTGPLSTAAARAMIESMSLPMLGAAADFGPAGAEASGSSWAAPGMVAERAHGWSVAQERSSSDLSLDFVAPELVLAARVYGLGPAEAAQAARLAIGGPGQLSAMAGAVDRTFVQAMAIEADRREAARSSSGAASWSSPGSAVGAPGTVSTSMLTTAFPTATGEISAALAPQGSQARELPTDFPTAGAGTSFGVERRAPRGAFLWPSATVAALGLHAALPDGAQSMSVAALELLAAQAVAEIGTYAAMSERFAPETLETTAAMGAVKAGELASDFVGGQDSVRGERAVGSGRVLGGPVGAAGVDPSSLAEPSEHDVLGAAAALVPSARRSRFDALYVALSQSPSGRTWSPAARAARALALAGRGETSTMSAYERAATAWDVLPVVYATDGMSISEIDAAVATGTLPSSVRTTQASSARGTRADGMPMVEGRPGLASLSARAGEALGSYVTPSTGELASAAAREQSSAPREVQSPAMRAPTAAPELVRTGRARHGGGEVEIPSWFEAAARKMFDERSGSSSSAEGFSLSELTLVNAAPATHIAASAVAAPSAAPSSPASSSGHKTAKAAAPIDIDKIANEVYRQVLLMMDAARARNGEPHL